MPWRGCLWKREEDSLQRMEKANPAGCSCHRDLGLGYGVCDLLENYYWTVKTARTEERWGFEALSFSSNPTLFHGELTFPVCRQNWRVQGNSSVSSFLSVLLFRFIAYRFEPPLGASACGHLKAQVLSDCCQDCSEWGFPDWLRDLTVSYSLPG